MRKFGSCLFLLLSLISCKPELPFDFITFSGTIENMKDSIITIYGAGIQKTIEVADDGSFKDTLKVGESDLYSFFSADGKGYIFLKNGSHLKLKGDANNFFKSFKYEGDDEAAGNRAWNRNRIDRIEIGSK